MLTISELVFGIIRMSDGRWAIITRDSTPGPKLYIYDNKDPPSDSDLLQTVSFSSFGWPNGYSPRILEHGGYLWLVWGNNTSGNHYITKCDITNDFSVQSNWKKHSDGTSGYDTVTASGTRCDVSAVFWDPTVDALLAFVHVYFDVTGRTYWNGTTWQYDTLTNSIGDYLSSAVSIPDGRYYVFIEDVYTYDIHAYKMTDYSNTSPTHLGSITDLLYPGDSAYYNSGLNRVYIAYYTKEAGAQKGVWYVDLSTDSLVQEQSNSWAKVAYGRWDGTSDFLVIHSDYTTGNLAWRVNPTGTDTPISGTLGIKCTAHQLNTTSRYKPIVTSNYDTSQSNIYFVDSGESTNAPVGETGTSIKNSATSATLYGNVTDLGGSASIEAWFEYGEDTSYGSETTHHTITSPSEISDTITVSRNKVYHYRLVMYANSTYYYGSDRTFGPLWGAYPGGTKFGTEISAVSLNQGSERATSYQSNFKVIRDASGNIYITYLDYTGSYINRIRKIYGGSGSTKYITDDYMNKTVIDNHSSGTLLIDSSGYIHTITGQHGYDDQMSHYVSNSPYSVNGWTKVGDIPNDYASYPSAVIDSSDTIHLIYRGYYPGSTKLYYQRKTPSNNWGDDVQIIFDGSGTTYYRAAYNATIAIDSLGRLHLGLHIYDYTHDYGVGMGYAYSDDGGNTWKKSDGSIYTLPITMSTIEWIEYDGTGASNTRGSNIVCDKNNRPWFIVYHMGTTDPLNIYHFDGSSWILKQISPDSGKQFQEANIGIGLSGSTDVVYVVAAQSNVGGGWTDTSNDLYAYTSTDYGNTFNQYPLDNTSDFDGLPNIEAKVNTNYSIDYPYLLHVSKITAPTDVKLLQLQENTYVLYDFEKESVSKLIAGNKVSGTKV